MTTRTKLAALQILTLREEFSKRELRDALALANELAVVLTSGTKQKGKSAHSPRTHTSNLSGSESRVVAELRERDPHRYSILSKIDQSMRLGIILPRMSDIRRVGYSFDKKFVGGKSKRDAIPRLMETLSKLPISELEHAYVTWKRDIVDHRGLDTEYDELAEFLIKGTRSSISSE